MPDFRLDEYAYIPFHGSQRPTLGVELELQIVHPETMNLHAGSPAILQAVGHEHNRIKPELTQSTIEVITGICGTVAEATRDLAGSLRTLYAIGDREGFTFSASGTHPFGRWSQQAIYPTPRYEALVERIQWAARRLNIYGMHVHVGVGSGERAIAIGNALTTYLPHMLALSCSSPFVDSEDTGLCSCRVKIFEVMPTAGVPYRLANYGEFQAFMNALLRSGSIESIREIWWDIRPHPSFGTIEVRICDMPATLSDAAGLAALIQSLVVYLDRRYERGVLPPMLHPWIVKENKWRATRYGLAASVITDNMGTQAALQDDLSLLLETLDPIAHELGCRDELRTIYTMMARGSSSDRQRERYAATGDLTAVVAHLAQGLRDDATAHAAANLPADGQATHAEVPVAR